MKRIEVYFGILRIVSDAAMAAIALLFAYWLRLKNIDLIPVVHILEPAKTLPDPAYFTNNFLIPSVILFVAVAALLKLYLIRVTLGAFRETSRIASATIVWVGLVMGWYFFVQKQLFYSRALLLHATFFIFIFVAFGRMFLTIAQRAFLKRGIGVRTVASAGTRPLPDVVWEFLKHDPRYSYTSHISSTDSRHVAKLRGHDLVIQTDPSTSEETNRLIDFCRSHHIGYAFLPPVLTDVPHLLSVCRFGSVPILRFHPTPLDGWGAVFKMIFDWIIAAMLVVILSPALVIIAICIKLESKGPVFYVSRRVGQKHTGTQAHRYIKVFKFRSMVKDADACKEKFRERSHRNDGPLFKIKNDPRITKTGKILRRFSLDELPQLINVLRGDLSLVGPRPHLPEEVDQYTDFQRRVFAVKPGITGLAQVSGRSNLAFSEEVRLDLQYIEEWSPWLDALILWKTFVVVLQGRGAD